MKHIILGFICGCALMTGLFLYISSNKKDFDFGNNVYVSKKGDSAPGEMEIYREGEVLASVRIYANGFSIRVPSEYGFPETMLFSEIDQEGRKIRDLKSSRLLEDKKVKHVEYDMESGEVEYRVFFGEEDEVQVFDKDWNQVEIDLSEPVAGGDRTR